MNHVLELPRPFDTSPRFSKVTADPFSPLRTASAIYASSRAGNAVGSNVEELDQKIFGFSTPNAPLLTQLFAATAQAKIWTSGVAMHLDRAVRDRLFRQLDSLHDADEWVSGDTPVNLESYKSCVRAILYHDIDSRPALALMPSGNILALWNDGQDKLSVEFLPGNKTRWMVQSNSASGVERAAGTAPIERLRDVIAPYCADRWFSAG